MSVNNFKPHVLILPEDDANRQIANGFLLEPALKSRSIQILLPAGGWPSVRDSFVTSHNAAMAKFPDRLMVLLVDFDKQSDRLEGVISKVEASLRERVFVLGAYGEPEELKKYLGSYETIGKALASDCAANATSTWAHGLLRHNSSELSRMMARIRSILF